MRNEPGAAVYDSGLRLEAYRFRRSFPKHFHEYYVIGYVADGRGGFICKDAAYTLKKGDIVICNPGDSHSCAESGAALDYWGLHIPRETMLGLAEEAPGRQALRTGFSDQSHFTNYFSRFIGLAPGAYRELFQEE